jgi:hypothetical protein
MHPIGIEGRLYSALQPLILLLVLLLHSISFDVVCFNQLTSLLVWCGAP